MGEKNIVWKGEFEIDLVKQDSLTVMRHHAAQQIKKLQEQMQMQLQMQNAKYKCKFIVHIPCAAHVPPRCRVVMKSRK